MAMYPPMCEICNEDFDDSEHQPRILPCSHSLCSFCISELIKDENKTCPFCRAEFIATTVEDVVINRDILDIAKQFADQGIAKVAFHSLQQHSIADIGKKIADCRRRITTLKEAIESNKTLENGLQKINKDMRSNISKYLEAQEKESKTLLTTLKETSMQMQKQYDSLFTEEQQLVAIITKMSEATNFTSACTYIDKAAVIVKTLEEMAEKENYHIALTETNTREILKVHFEADEIAGLFQQNLERTIDNGLLTANSLARMSPSLRRMIESGMVLAFQDKEGVRRYAPMRLESGTKLYLYHLREDQQLPQDAQLIKHDHVLELLNSRPYRTFLELQIGETVIGRLVIKLDAEGSFPKNFLHMCAGTSGPSFANGKILEVREKNEPGESVAIGKDQAEQAAVSGVDWDQEYMKKIYERNLSNGQLGLVGGWYGPGILHLSKFYVVTKDYIGPLRPCFGEVEEGLEVLTNAISQWEDVTQIRVINSGIIISL